MAGKKVYVSELFWGVNHKVGYLHTTLGTSCYSPPDRTTLTKIWDLPDSRMLNSMVQSKSDLEVKIFFQNLCFETELSGTFLNELSLNLQGNVLFLFSCCEKVHSTTPVLLKINKASLAALKATKLDLDCTIEFSILESGKSQIFVQVVLSGGE